MSLTSGNELFNQLANTLHRETQEQEYSCDLTVNRVFELFGNGALDFGGSEFRKADHESLQPELKDPNDDYGWWKLENGRYLIEYNEKPGELATPGIVLPHTRLLHAGVSHPAFLLEPEADSIHTILHVGEGRCKLKENCRISTLIQVS